jgi:hypothetical protein
MQKQLHYGRFHDALAPMVNKRNIEKKSSWRHRKKLAHIKQQKELKQDLNEKKAKEKASWKRGNAHRSLHDWSALKYNRIHRRRVTNHWKEWNEEHTSKDAWSTHWKEGNQE